MSVAPKPDGPKPDGPKPDGKAITTKRVLVVEDEALVALYTGELLEQAGHQVVGLAATGAVALALAAEHQPELALVDIRLPGGMDGIEIATELTARYRTSIIFVSGTLDAETLVRARAIHPYACLEKPVRPSDLLDRVNHAPAGGP